MFNWEQQASHLALQWRSSGAPLSPDEQSSTSWVSVESSSRRRLPEGGRGPTEICTFCYFPPESPSGHWSFSTQQSRQAPLTSLWLHPTFPVNSARHQPKGLTGVQGAEQRRLCKSSLVAFQQPRRYLYLVQGQLCFRLVEQIVKAKVFLFLSSVLYVLLVSVSFPSELTTHQGPNMDIKDHWHAPSSAQVF